MFWGLTEILHGRYLTLYLAHCKLSRISVNICMYRVEGEEREKQFSIDSDFVPQRTVGNVWIHLWLSQPGGEGLGVSSGTQCVDSRDTAKNSTMHTTGPHNRIIQNKISIILRLRNKREQESEKQCDIMQNMKRICKGRYIQCQDRRVDQNSRFKIRLTELLPHINSEVLRTSGFSFVKQA